MTSVIQLWTGPLPTQHLWISPQNRPHEIKKLIRVYVRKWIVHPIKRRVAKYYVSILKKFNGLKVIAITGSAGKTTTKEMLLAILSQADQTVASFANIDPVYNIPTTILRCSLETKYLILEMGIEYIGEMNFYTWMVKPDIAVITNVNLTHTEFLNDLETVGSEKGSIGIFASHLVISALDKNIKIATSGQVHKVTPGRFKLQLLGKHLQQNAALAAKVAEILGISKQQTQMALEGMLAPSHRLQLIRTDQVTIIDDSYNANPLATKASIDTLVEYANFHRKTPVFVFGQMNELGKFEASAHNEIKTYIKKRGVEHVLTIGPATKNIGLHFESQEELIKKLKKYITPKHVVLVKGSRSWHLEHLVEKLIS